MTAWNESECQRGQLILRKQLFLRVVDSECILTFFPPFFYVVLTFGSDYTILHTVFLISEYSLIVPWKLFLPVKISTLIILNIDRDGHLCREGSFRVTQDQNTSMWIVKTVSCIIGIRVITSIRFLASYLSVRYLGFLSFQMHGFSHFS